MTWSFFLFKIFVRLCINWKVNKAFFNRCMLFFYYLIHIQKIRYRKWMVGESSQRHPGELCTHYTLFFTYSCPLFCSRVKTIDVWITSTFYFIYQYYVDTTIRCIKSKKIDGMIFLRPSLYHILNISFWMPKHTNFTYFFINWIYLLHINSKLEQ